MKKDINQLIKEIENAGGRVLKSETRNMIINQYVKMFIPDIIETDKYEPYRGRYK